MVRTSSLPCVKQSFGSSSIVCVCNATYCDTVEEESKLPEGIMTVYSTSKTGSRLNKSEHGAKLISKTDKKLYRKSEQSPDVLYFIVPRRTAQTIVGFGGTFTDAAGMNVASLPDGAQKNLIESYFGPTGIEYNLGRIPIASNDMSTDIYSYDFTRGDIYLSKFTIAAYDHLYKLPYIDQAVVASRRNLSLFASPWSSPDWMKTNDNMVGVGTILPKMAKVYADYLGRFLREYESFMFHGRMWGLTTQSGPSRSCSNDSIPEYQSVCWSPQNMSDWIKYDLKRSLEDNGYGHIKLFTMDDNVDELDNWRSAFDAISLNLVDGFAVQGYHDNVSDDNTTNYNNASSPMCDMFSLHPDKILLGSEYCIRSRPELGSWERGADLAKHVFHTLQNCGSGFTHYNLAVDLDGGPSWVYNYADSPIVVDAKQAKGGVPVFYKQPMFYTMGHFSKFITAGSVAIEMFTLEDVPAGIYSVGFMRPDNYIVVVVGNFGSKGNIVGFRDSRYYFEFSMEASSIHTFIWMHPADA
ncbi:hypothetical protein DPMN_085113 [Dreissena polymorpha]|uniref:Glucosylceramidase n=2 Tax=Dreissena polymorpha TaxID=45954 RepID=A0A9D3YG85_DREPO|nr:hypothetical protein DPMN_085113 [Dreissena polymorpha]